MRVHSKHERKLGVRIQTIAGRMAKARMTKRWRKKKIEIKSKRLCYAFEYEGRSEIMSRVVRPFVFLPRESLVVWPLCLSLMLATNLRSN